MKGGPKNHHRVTNDPRRAKKEKGGGGGKRMKRQSRREKESWGGGKSGVGNGKPCGGKNVIWEEILKEIGFPRDCTVGRCTMTQETPLWAPTGAPERDTRSGSGDR